MAVQQTGFRTLNSIAGTTLMGLGVFILHENLAGAIARLSHVFGANRCEALGVLFAITQAVARLVQAYGAGHQGFLRGLLEEMLVSCWPLLLVMVGTVLSRDGFTDNVNPLRKKDSGDVDLSTGGSTLK